MDTRVDLRLVQLDPAWLEPAENLRRVTEIAERESADGADLVVFPELSNIGYVTPLWPGGTVEYGDGSMTAERFKALYTDLAEEDGGAFVEALTAVARASGCTFVIGLARRSGDRLYNSAVLIGPAGLIGIQDKVHIPPQEQPFFAAGEKLAVFETPVARVGLAICYDSRFPEVGRFHALNGADLSITVYAGTDTHMRFLATEKTLLYRAHVRAQENGLYYATCNRVGAEGSATFIGHSVICAPSGAVLAAGDREPGVVGAVLSGHDLADHRRGLDVLADRRPQAYG